MARMRSDGTVVEVLAYGNERPFPDAPMRPMMEAEVHAAALRRQVEKSPALPRRMQDLECT